MSSQVGSPAQVPLVTDRKVALRYLDESWVLWQRYGKPDYTYTRAYQESSDTVVFVVSTVKDGAVQRTTTLETSLEGLGDVEKYRSGGPLRVVADERGGAEGSHTIPELYQLCRTQIAQQDFAGVRLYFHHWGLLQHCGYLSEECEDCETVSIHSYYPHAVPDQAHVMEFFCPDAPAYCRSTHSFCAAATNAIAPRFLMWPRRFMPASPPLRR